MSDDLLAAAAAALGAPPEIVMRSAQARASAEGTTVEDVLAAWAGGAPPPAAPTAEPSPEPAAAEDISEAAPPPEPAPAPEPAVTAPTPPAAAVPVVIPKAVPISEMPAPVLEGRKDRPMAVLFGALALFLAGVLGSVILPAFAEETDGVLILRSELAEVGRTVYLQEGCGYCHTQLVRPIVTDVHLGPVTEASDFGSEFPGTQGVMRVGPDLAHVGSRPIAADAATLTAFLLGDGQFAHQSYRYLSEPDLAALVAYLQSLVD